ncbi:MAG TPA: hypothetical protein VHR72_11875, partial [Gemmataceae bacterium]|nr:hypothetical protein [Gemmataceae bacterium]
GRYEQTLRVWDLSSGRCLRTMSGHKERIITLSLNRDGRLALTGSADNSVRLWDTTTGQCLRTFVDHPSNLCSVAISQDGSTGVSGGWDKTLFRWRLTWDQRAPSMICRATAFDSARAAQEANQRALRQAKEALTAADPASAAGHLRVARSQEGYGREPASMAAWCALYRHLRRRTLKAAWEIKTLPVPGEEIDALFFSADGKRLLSSTRTSKFHLWSLPDGRRLWEYKVKDKEYATGSHLFRDGRQVLIGTSKNVERCDADTGTCLRTFADKKWHFKEHRVSADERRILAGDGKHLSLIDLSNGACLQTFKDTSGSYANSVLSADARLVLRFGYRAADVWDATTGRLLRSFGDKIEGWRRSAWLSIDGRRALFGGDYRVLEWWDIATGSCLRPLEGHTGDVTSVCLTADDRFALSASKDTTVRIWDLATGQCLRTLEGHTHPVKVVCVSQDGALAVSAGEDAGIKIWQLDWELEANRPADWDEAARPYLETFLTLQTPPKTFLRRRNRPEWSNERFAVLLDTLACAGFGWLRPEGVRGQLDKMAADWQGPPPLS